MPYDIDRVAASLRANRAYVKESRQQTADNVGIPASTLASYEHAESGMSLENAWRLADYYGKSIDDLVERKR